MPSAHATIAVKRAYEKPAASDGTRILVDRIWPRGLTKDDVRINAWLRDLAPSNELRKWFHSNTDEWHEFRKRYLRELQSASAAEALNKLHDLLNSADHVTLIFASKQVERNNATVLKEFIEEKVLARKNPRVSDRTGDAAQHKL